MISDQGGEQPLAVLRISNVKSVLAVLHAVKSRAGGKQQFCTLFLGSDGLSVRWEDDSKALQSSVFLKPNIFSCFNCQDPRRVLGVSFTALMDTMAVFASSSAELEMRYPGQEGELVMETTENLGGGEISSYARVSCQQMPLLRDLSDYWEEPSSYFLGQGQLFKEVIDDMEWAGGSVHLELIRDPPTVRFTSMGNASGNGRLVVSIPVGELSGFQCAVPKVECSFPLKRLQVAFTNLPVAKDPSAVSTKVTLDSQGLMKVAHMVNMNSTAPPLQPAALSQAGGATGIVQFMMLPAELDFEDA